jgi:hypothetical protein
MIRYDSVEAFYADNEERRGSGEMDFGVWWWDGPQGHSGCWRVSCVQVTGEIYAECRPHSGPGVGEVLLLGFVEGGGEAPPEGGSYSCPLAYQEAERLLEGWEEVCGLARSLEWAVNRVARGALLVSFLVRASLVGAHVHASVWAGPVTGQRGSCGALVFRQEEWPAFQAMLLAGERVELELDPALVPSQAVEA